MDCEETIEKLSARMDGELPEAERIALDAHLAACASCRVTDDALRLQDSQLEHAFRPRREASAEVARRVLSGSADPAPRPSRPWTRWVSHVGAIAAGFLVAFLFLPWSEGPGSERGPGAEPPAPRAARLALATGKIEFLDGPEWKALATGAEIPDGARVRTGAGVRCEFVNLEGSEVRLNGGTEIAFHESRKLTIEKGELWTKVAPGQRAFEVATPHAKVVALGTQFDVKVEDQKTALLVARGRTRVEARSGQAEVGEGEAIVVDRGVLGSKENEDAHSLFLATRWVHEILLLKGRKNEELAGRVDDLLAQIGATKILYMAEEDIRALGDHCVLPLARYLERSDSRERPGAWSLAARILADIAQPWAIGDLIRLLGHQDALVRSEIARGLERLLGHRGPEGGELSPEEWKTGPAERREAAALAWAAWWEKNRDRFPSPP